MRIVLVSYLDSRRFPIIQHVVDRSLRDKAQVFTPGLDTTSFRLKLMTGEVQIDFLVAKLQGVPREGK